MVTHVLSIEPHATLRAAIQRMRDEGVRCLLVEPPRPGLGLGILTVKDAVTAWDWDAGDAIADELRVDEVATRPVVAAQATLEVPECVRLMRMTGVRRLPILRGEELVGMLSYTDVFRYLADHVGV
ncbi:MAG: CBS domain-containing protein [Planctomycetes bacterium]|nr:CBS domain-containing protein [Planctomycetota bacterium]